MQTRFTPEQLSNPGLREADKQLRACVHCGFCTATCPTYQLLGDEADSPRGRIYLIKEMLEEGRPADAKTVQHIDRCLSCLSCRTTCPSGVNYMHLVDHARAHIEQTWKRPLTERLLRSVIAKVLPHPLRFRLALGFGRLAKPFRGLIPDPRLRAMLNMVPARLPPVSRNDDPQSFPAQGPQKLRLALLTGCAQRALNTDINDATIRLLTRLGAEVVVVKGAGCCGALTHHMGREAEAKASAAALIRAVMTEVRGAGLDGLIINTSGCGTTVKDYGHLFRDDPTLAAEAATIAALAGDVTEWVHRAGLPEGLTAPEALRIAYHSACSLQHGQQIRSLPKELLQQAGFSVSEPADPHLCCGSAGTYNLLQPEISLRLQADKVAKLEARSPDVIAAGNLGCMMQIGNASRVPVVHTAELLDWATGGPKPPALSERE
ncbi:glycolate oxidase subunit GlcF [Falsigemmobacter faecalis]|uniref:Glycolate oxidase iron-sulfur subunit n=1 Tax=Falsigemmobacter faecalis TaxID=2488730 RepID=A0A3P3DT30_9RHOB|nr:glycolate oxidase subunit GlcF [Falsigemmobacter faecalis]RRH76846.1 glycolate oxidase iron-sulfur subunit [Falsigemmobacter faecalis]